MAQDFCPVNRGQTLLGMNRKITNPIILTSTLSKLSLSAGCEILSAGWHCTALHWNDQDSICAISTNILAFKRIITCQNYNVFEKFSDFMNKI